MKTFYLLATICAILLIQDVAASDLTVENVETVYQRYPSEKWGYNLTVSWKNSWHNDKNHDAAWVILKSLKASGYDHMPLKLGSAKLLWKKSDQMPEASINVAEDGTGMFVFADENYRGDLSYRIYVEHDTTKFDFRDRTRGGVRGYGIEMVFVPEGGFTLGDPKESALDYFAFYNADEEGNYDGLYEIKEEKKAIEVGPNNLYYKSDRDIYRGDQKGPIPVDFPKGVQAFYLMKYEITQGIYTDFLNSLSASVASIRFTGGNKDYRKYGGTIRMTDKGFVADRPEQRMVFIHWDDQMAFMDWAALRPYTELEYTKACRGPMKPIENEMAWNTSNLDLLARKIDGTTNYMENQKGLTEGDLNDQNRAVFGASYYWVFDLSGSMWEKVITVGDSVGRAFTGTHGDGNISYYGFADTEDWPHGFSDSEGGYGYRGGGHYGDPWISNANPYSPIAHRPYAAWSAGPRNAAYGSRGARTVD